MRRFNASGPDAAAEPCPATAKQALNARYRRLPARAKVPATPFRHAGSGFRKTGTACRAPFKPHSAVTGQSRPRRAEAAGEGGSVQQHFIPHATKTRLSPLRTRSTLAARGIKRYSLGPNHDNRQNQMDDRRSDHQLPCHGGSLPLRSRGPSRFRQSCPRTYWVRPWTHCPVPCRHVMEVSIMPEIHYNLWKALHPLWSQA